MVNNKTRLMDGAKRIAKSRWSLGSIILLLIATVYLIYILFKITSYIDKLQLALTPPKLPNIEWNNTEHVNPTGWPEQNADWFHFASQGTATLPIPYDWFLALEAPKSHPRWAILGKRAPLFIDDYIYKHGFIKTDKSVYNPDGLPIGFAKTPSVYFKGINRHSNALGFTCAACHTGQFTYQDTRYVVDGGPAVTDLGQFTKSIGAALGQTELSGKFAMFDGRFNRFAARVLGDNNNVISRSRLKEELTATIESLKGSVDVIKVTEGFTRNDALNRIGNQVFSQDMGRHSNYTAISAPVTYPHIWTTSWFDWVQYDGSIMQPLIRNAGEALGVKAYLNTTAPNDQRFASSINMSNLEEIENWLSGTHPQENGNQFNGLRAPKWPVSLPQIDQNLRSKGKDLYTKHCSGCHLPATDSPKFWQEKYWQPIKYYTSSNEYKQTDKAYLKLKIIKLDDIGTDPSQAGVLTNRRVDSTDLNLNTEVCTPASFEIDGQPVSGLKYVELQDSATGNFGLQLGAVVERTNQQWFKQNYTTKTKQNQMKGGRPNCLQVGKGYKARPLNGVWATAPFLHNGSVATIYDLLTPASERPTFVELGNPAFDPIKLGLTQSEDVGDLNSEIEAQKEHAAMNDYSKDGYFILDTRQMGNLNTGHSFEGDHKGYARNGVVGPALSEDEKMALIEYLKSI